ncbi:Uncharacterised protein [Vibrio cholerae]|nr:Uncharacterised protein [Vibrio cholerae]
MILPPTIIEQPTSVTIREKPAMVAAIKGKRASQTKVAKSLGTEAPSVIEVSSERRSVDCNAPCIMATRIGKQISA